MCLSIRMAVLRLLIDDIKRYAVRIEAPQTGGEDLAGEWAVTPHQCGATAPMMRVPAHRAAASLSGL
jgi:hypothetical protein